MFGGLKKTVSLEFFAIDILCVFVDFAITKMLLVVNGSDIQLLRQMNDDWSFYSDSA